MTEPTTPSTDPAAFQGQVLGETLTDLGPATVDAAGVLRAPPVPVPGSSVG